MSGCADPPDFALRLVVDLELRLPEVVDPRELEEVFLRAELLFLPEFFFVPEFFVAMILPSFSVRCVNQRMVEESRAILLHNALSSAAAGEGSWIFKKRHGIGLEASPSYTPPGNYRILRRALFSCRADCACQ